MKLKTSVLIGPALDWAVAKAGGLEVIANRLRYFPPALFLSKDNSPYSPSTEWSQAGPIIEREQIRLAVEDSGTWWAEVRHDHRGERAFTSSYYKAIMGTAPTPLIAAMRCYVTSKLGDEVEIPEELYECRKVS